MVKPEHVVDVVTKVWPPASSTQVAYFSPLYRWECSCGAKQLSWRSSIGSAEQSGRQHLAHMLTESR